MEDKLMQISCDPSCGFMVRSHHKSEVIDLAKKHVLKHHKDLKVTDVELNKMVTTA